MPKSDFNNSQGAKGAEVDSSGDKLWPMLYDRVAYLVSKSTCWTCWKTDLRIFCRPEYTDQW